MVRVIFVLIYSWLQLGIAIATTSLPTAILVDKKTNTLNLCQHLGENYKILKTFHATLGAVKGDKEEEDDLKTPEGIYTFDSLTTPPALQKKFGLMAFHMNFPNTFDRLAGRTGSNIMLHATDEPGRLKQNYDSKGCVVVNNEEISEIKPFIHLGLTPILIFADLKEEFLRPGANAPLRSFFNNWLKNWQQKDIEHYIQSYHSDFTASGKNRSAWHAYKSRLNRTYSSIEIQADNVLIYRHPKYSMITFTQDYRAKLASNGGWGHRSRGTKILFIAEEEGQPKIIAENFTQLAW